jgi:hypothetical protein
VVPEGVEGEIRPPSAHLRVLSIFLFAHFIEDCREKFGDGHDATGGTLPRRHDEYISSYLRCSVYCEVMRGRKIPLLSRVEVQL